MVDRLIPVRRECAAGQAELPVEVDGGGEGEDACGDAGEMSPSGVLARWCSSWSWSFSVLTIDSIRWRIRPIGGLGTLRLVGAAWAAGGGRRSSRDCLLEVGAGEALVGDYELAG